MTQRLKQLKTALGLSTILGLAACGGPNENLSQEALIKTPWLCENDVLWYNFGD